MKSTSFALLAMTAGLISAESVFAQTRPIDLVRFGDGRVQAVTLLGKEALVYDDDGKPQFSAGEEFLGKAAGSGPLRAYEWDLTAGRIRINSPGTAGLWLECAAVVPMPIACGTSFTLVTDGVLEVGQSVETSSVGSKSYSDDTRTQSGSTGAVPRCPGDPRCPKIKD